MLPRSSPTPSCDYTRQLVREAPGVRRRASRHERDTRPSRAEFIGAQPGRNRAARPDFARPQPFRQWLAVARRRRGRSATPTTIPANVYPWIDLARRGVVDPLPRTRHAPARSRPNSSPRRSRRSTRLVALASVQFFTGYRIDVDAIGALLHERGVLFSLDAIQTLGAFPLSRRARRFPQRRRAQMDARPARHRHRVREKGALRPAPPHPARRVECALAELHRAATKSASCRHRPALRTGRAEHRRHLRNARRASKC